MHTLNDEYKTIKEEKVEKTYIIKETYLNNPNNIGEKDYAINFLSGPIVA